MSYDDLVNEVNAWMEKAWTKGCEEAAAVYQVDSNQQPSDPRAHEGGGGDEARTNQQKEWEQFKVDLRTDLNNSSRLFSDFTDVPDPTTFNLPLDRFEEIDRLLNLDGGKPVNVQLSLLTEMNALEDWSGDAAAAFHREYIKPATGWINNQHYLAQSLHGVVAGEQKLWQEARFRVDNLLHAADKAIDASDDVDWGTVAAVAAPVAEFVLSRAKNPLTEIAGTAIVELLKTAAESEGKPEETTIKGSDVRAVVQSTNQQLELLKKQIGDAEEVLAQAAAALSRGYADTRNNFLPEPPKLADATSGTVTGEEYLGTNS